MNDVLTNLQNQTISAKEAYQELYGKPKKVKGPRRAHFIRLKIRTSDDKAANRLLGILFALPVPLGLVRFGLRFVKNEETLPMPKKELFDLISHKGIKVQVKTQSGDTVYIKTL